MPSKIIPCPECGNKIERLVYSVDTKANCGNCGCQFLVAAIPGAPDYVPVNDPINPDHYKNHPSGIECIEITRHMNFNCGNAIKYLWRNGLKDGAPQVDDIKKAIWYLQDEVKRLEKQ